MKQRLLVAAIGVPLLILVLVFLPPLATAFLVVAIAGAAAYELLTKAEAEAQANRKIAESLTDGLIAYTYAENWNGELPTFMTGDGAMLPMFDMSSLLQPAQS